MERRRAQLGRQLQNRPLQPGERREADTEGSIVRLLGAGIGAVQALEIRATRPYRRLDFDMVRAPAQRSAQVIARRPRRDGGRIHAAFRVRGASADDQLRGREHPSAAEARLASTGDQQPFVDVEMLDRTERLDIRCSQRERCGLARAIGERVGMADALVLAYLDQPVVERRLRRLLDEYVSVVQASDATSASSACAEAGFTR